MEQQVAQLTWSIFDSNCADDWAKVKEEFQEAEAACTRATQEVTDACFRSRSPASSCILDVKPIRLEHKTEQEN